ncbi:hypothetical protein QBC41DRAFT_229881 [Cercophora samala]|uniref:Uncharacterized protein n=1 Tax=Cercophora samala TaxID=330535 RepID=A0AA40D9G2_9PEZI|nr:hypothetical protein QBC41DRAFT_229881 [Cercophora samala]
MHLTVRFISKYFASLDKYERTVHIPVNLYDPATRTFTNYEMNAKLRGRDYPYGRLAKERDPEYSYLVENPFPKTLRQQGNDHTTRKGGRAGTPSSRPGTPSARPGTPTSRPGSSQGRAATPTGRPAPTTTTTGRPGTTSTSRPGTSSGLRPGSRG